MLTIDIRFWILIIGQFRWIRKRDFNVIFFKADSKKILQNIFSWQNLPFYCSAHHKNLIIFIYLTLEKQKKASEGFTTTFSLDTYTELLLLLYQVFFVSVVVTILQNFTMFCLFTHHLRNSHFPLFYFRFLKMSVRHMGWSLWNKILFIQFHLFKMAIHSNYWE